MFSIIIFFCQCLPCPPRYQYYLVRLTLLTMSMIRCPQRKHLSADCWKPEYCREKRKESSAQAGQRDLATSPPASRITKNVFERRVTLFRNLSSLCGQQCGELQNTLRHKSHLQTLIPLISQQLHPGIHDRPGSVKEAVQRGISL